MANNSVKKLLNEFTHSQWVVYLLLIVSVINLITYLHKNDLSAIAIFLAIGFSVSRYTKNMVYVLLTAIVITNLFVSMGYLNNLGQKSVKTEGFEDKKKKDRGGRGQGGAKVLNQASKELDTNNSRSHTTSAGQDVPTASSVSIDKNAQSIDSPPHIRSTLLKESSVPSGSSNKGGSQTIASKSIKEEKAENQKNKQAMTNYSDNMNHFLKQLQDMMGGEEMNIDKLQQESEKLHDMMDKMIPLVNGAENMMNKLQGGALGKMLGMN